MSKRAPGEGSVFRTADGSGWMYSISVPRPTGGRRRVRGRAATRAAALAKLRAAKSEVDQIGGVPDRARKLSASVDDYRIVRAGQRLAARTLAQDEWAYRLITTGLGHRGLGALTVADCDRFLAAVAAGEFGRPVGRAQVRRVRQKLVRVIENDQRRGLVGRNVAELSVLPEDSPALVGRREARALSRAELGRLVDGAGGVTKVLIDLSGRNGLRPAEARAVRWDLIDLDRQTLTVAAQMNRQNELAPVKTKRSKRTVRLDDRSIRLLSDWRKLQGEQREAAGLAWIGNELGLVATSLFGTALNQRNVHRSIVQVCERVGIHPHASGYDLRHTAITLMVENGHPAYRVADWAGTSERMIADVYRHKLDLVSDLGPIENPNEMRK